MSLFFFSENATEEEKRQLVREIELMKEVGTHRNIVSMLGYWIQSPPIMLIMEFVPNGDLLQWLKNKRQQVSLLYQLYQYKFAALFFAFCLKNPCSPYAVALRLSTIYIMFVFLSSKCQVCLIFVMEITKMAEVGQTLQISHSDVISMLCCTLIFK